jgi:hypothetical protein
LQIPELDDKMGKEGICRLTPKGLVEADCKFMGLIVAPKSKSGFYFSWSNIVLA